MPRNQEEIRGWLITCLAIQRGTIHGKSPTDEQAANSILSGLHSQGVVIKVEGGVTGGEVPCGVPCDKCVATEPLVEE